MLMKRTRPLQPKIGDYVTDGQITGELDAVGTFPSGLRGMVVTADTKRHSLPYRSLRPAQRPALTNRVVRRSRPAAR